MLTHVKQSQRTDEQHEVILRELRKPNETPTNSQTEKIPPASQQWHNTIFPTTQQI